MERNKNKRVGISLTEEEYEKAKAYAFKLQMPLSALARDLLLDAINGTSTVQMNNNNDEDLGQKVDELLAWKDEVDGLILDLINQNEKAQEVIAARDDLGDLPVDGAKALDGVLGETISDAKDTSFKQVIQSTSNTINLKT